MTPTDPLEAALAEGLHKAMCFGPTTLHNRLACDPRRREFYLSLAQTVAAHPAVTTVLATPRPAMDYGEARETLTTDEMLERASPRPAGVDALRRAAQNVSDRRTLLDDGFWVSQKEMRALDAALSPSPVSEPVEPTDDDLRDSLQKFVDASSPVSEPVEPAIDRVYWDSAVDISGMKRVGDPVSEPVDGLPNRGQRICPFCDGAGVVGKEDNQ